MDDQTVPAEDAVGTGWALLPDRVNTSRVSALNSRLKLRLVGLARDGGLELRLAKAGHVSLRSLHETARDDLVYAKPLQDDDGAFLPDAGTVIGQDTFAGGDSHTDAVSAFLQQPGADVGELPRLARVQLALMERGDPLPELRTWASADPGLSFHRLGGTERLRRRLAVWRMLEQLALGMRPEEVRPSWGVTGGGLLYGIPEALPGSIMCAPMTARSQPLAMVLQLGNGAQIAVTPRHGVFVRTVTLADWPTGIDGPSFSQGGLPLYGSAEPDVPAGHGAALLYQLAAGMNRLVRRMTEPDVWVRDGVVSFDERVMTSASVRLGFDTLTTMGADWQRHADMWTAFRALDMLAGLWQGASKNAVPLHRLLDPGAISAHAVTQFDPVEQFWATEQLATYEARLCAAFGGITLQEAVRELDELRNLVHGVGAGSPHSERRIRRLHVLRSLERSGGSVELLPEVARFWWMALLLAPDQFCRPGEPPWGT